MKLTTNHVRLTKSTFVHWLATAILLLCGTLAPSVTHAAPRAQGQTVERWVDGLAGDDSNNCTRLVEPGEDDGDPDTYVYSSCKTIGRALALANHGDIIRVAGGIPNPMGGTPYLNTTYPENLQIRKKVTIIGGYQTGFGAQIEPPRYSSLSTTIIGNVDILGATFTPLLPPEISGDAPMEVRLETLSVSIGGIYIISQAVSDPLLRPANRVNVTLEGVTVSGGTDFYGAGLYIDGASNHLKITKSIIQNNVAAGGGGFGGGIHVSNGSSLDVGAGTIIRNNVAANGGGIAANNALTITVSGGVTITNNTGSNDGGGINSTNSLLNIGSDTFIQNNNGGDGAGLFINGGTISLSGAKFSNNISTDRGGAIFAAYSAPSMQNLEISQNRAVNGGGVYLFNLTGGELTSSKLMSNTATSGNGGGINIDGGTGIVVSSLVVQGNAAPNGGGGYVTNSSNLTMQGNDFLKNSTTSNGKGGGLFLNVTAPTIQSNSFGQNVADYGGGLYIQQSNNATISGNTFTSNRASYGGGVYLYNTNNAKFGGIDLLTNHATQQGGGLYATNAATIQLGSSTIQGNSSDVDGAGLYVIDSTLAFTTSAFFDANLATAKGGGGYLGSGAALTFSTLDLQNNEARDGGGFYLDGGRATISGATSFVGNKANGGNGGALYLKGSGSTATQLSNLFAQNNKAANGGVFYADGVSLTLGTMNLTGNEATNGSGGGAYFSNSTLTLTNTATLIENKSSQHGGGIYANASSITLSQGVQFNGNQAQGGNGGAAYLTGSNANSASFGASTFTENLASQNGGGIYVNSVQVSIASTASFQGNIAQTGDGGGFYLTGTSLTLGGINLKSNNAFLGGGGGYFTNGNLTITASTLFDANSAQTGSGGALYITSASSVVITNTVFSNNVGGIDGGALHVTNSPITIQGNSALNSNTATNGRGGAIFVSGSNATLTNLSFSKNKAGNGGGALHITTGTFSLTSSTLSENNGGTDGLGGGAYIKATSATLTNNTISKNVGNSGAGLYIADTPAAVLNSQQVLENNSSGPGGGVYLYNSTVEINTSTLRANQASGEGGAIYALHSRATVNNTLVAANKVTDIATYAAGVYLLNSAFNATHATFANNAHQQLQGIAHAFYVAPPTTAISGAPTQSSLTLINTIVSGQMVGVNLLAGNDATFNAVLWNNDGFNWTGAGTFTVSRSRRGDPRFVSIATHDYHLRRDSAAFDQGIATAITTDRDGVARTQGTAPDIGAYEHRYTAGLYLTANLSTSFVRTGDGLTMNFRVQNQSGSAATGTVLRITLPSQLAFNSISQGSCQGIFCEINLGTVSPGADVNIQVNATVNGTALSNGLLTLLTNAALTTGNLATSDSTTSLSAYVYGCLAQVNGNTYPTLQAAMDAASNGQTIRISGVCGGVHQSGGPGQLLTINKNVTLQGGWNSSFTTLDPATYPTYLDSGALGRVIYLNGNFSPTFENLIIRNGNAAALGGGPGGKDAGGGVYINGGTPIFKNVDIANNQSPDLGGGVYLASSNVINFQGGYVRSNSAGERGGGLYINQSAPILTGVNIASNSARGGGGVYLYRSPAQFIDNAAAGSAPTCRFDTNTSSVMPTYVAGPSGGGLPVLWLTPGGGGGIVFDESAAIVRGCAIHNNSARVGGGAYLHNSAATIENSLFTANRALQPNPSAILIGSGGVRDGDGGGLVLDNVDPTTLTLRGLLLGNNQGVRGSGLLTRLARAGTLTLPHFTINTNSGGNAIFALGESRLAFVNSIVAFNTGGAAIFAQGGSSGEAASITLDYTLWHPPTQTKTGTSNGGTTNSTTEFEGDPAFRDDGYHLKRISFAYALGNNAFSFADRDGNPRPVGAKVELGADEYATAVTVRYVAVNGPGSAPCNDYRSPCASLQTALDASSDGDFIKMAVGDYTGVRNDGGRIHYARIEKNVTVEGGYLPTKDTNNNAVTDRLYTIHDWESPHPEVAATVIDVNEQGRVFWISGNVAPTLSNLTLRRGNALTLSDGPAGSAGGAGGGVYVDGASPIFRNVLVEDSRAHFGSGFYLRNAAGTYQNVRVLENGVGVENALGGGFYVQGGQPTIQAATIQANIAITGAGIYLDKSAATLAQNTVQSNGNGTTLDGGGVYIMAGTNNLYTNTIASNQAQHGGGVYVRDTQSTLRGNGINNNRAGAAQTPSGQNDALGGGLYIVGGAPVLTANTISGNQAIHTALAYGGGLYIAQSQAQISGNTINSNQAHRGAGLYFAQTTNITVQGNTINSNSAQAANEALRASGGGVYFATAAITFTTNSLAQNSAPYGAGLYIEGVGNNVLRQNTLTTNSAARDGGGIYLDGSDATLDSNTVQDNRSTGGRGAGIYARNGQATLLNNTLNANIAALEGGGIFLASDGTTMQGGIIQGNQAGEGAGIYVDGPAPGSMQAAAWVSQVTLAENRASNHGGGLYINNSSAQFTLNTLRANIAAVDGGGAYIQASTLAEFSGNLLRGNQAGEQGGGLFIAQRSTGNYHSNAIIDNTASQGGGVFVGGASPTLIHTTLARNGSGLVVMVQDGNPTTVILTNTIVAGHSEFGIQGYNGSNVATYATLWDGNNADLFGDGNLSSSDNVQGSAAFLADGYHIGSNSAAANRGLRSDVVLGNDIDNEGRFQGNGPELGADELTATCSIIVANLPNNVYDNMQDAIAAAPRDGTLLVAGSCTGVRTPSGVTTPQLAYFDKNLTVRGGYALGAWETSLPATQPTVLDAKALGRTIYVPSGVRVTLVNLTVINGSALGLGGGVDQADAGGNIFVNGGQLSLEGVNVINGRAVQGGGIYITAPIALVSTSIFHNNRADQAGGAIYLHTAPTSVEIRTSRFTNNRAPDGGAMYALAGTPLLLANTLQNNQTVGGNGRGGGFYLANSNATINRNWLFSNYAGLGGGIYITGGLPNVMNNMFIRNVAIQNGGAIQSHQAPIHLRHNTFVGNSTVQSGGSAINFAVGGEQLLTLTNNILVDHALALNVGEGNTLSARANLWNNNQSNWAGAVVDAGNNLLQVAPLFVNVAVNNYRLQETSPAVDKGVNIGVTEDIDGQSRPARQGYDIGADEYLRPSLSASLTALPDPVASGEEQTYVLQVINNGDTDLNARIQITLPTVLTPQGATLWENIFIARGAVWSQTINATVAQDYTGSLTAVMGVTSSQGATAAASATTTAAAVSGDILEITGESSPNPAEPGSTVELRLRIINRGGLPIGTTVQTQLPPGLTTSGSTTFAPTIAGPDGIWSTKINATLAPNVPILNSAGGVNELVTIFQIESDQGTSHTVRVVTTVANPALKVSRTPAPRPAISGRQLVYTLMITNTGNIALNTQINNTFPPQVAPNDLAHTQPINVLLTPGQVYQERMTTTVEAGYVGPLPGSVQISTDKGIAVTVQDQLNAQAQSLTPTATAKGGNWHDPDAWEPRGVPATSAVVLIPEGVSLYSNSPLTLAGLINRGTLEMRTTVGTSQAITLTNVLENYGEILGRNGTGIGEAGLTLNLASAILYNEGTICAGNGAPQGGAGGDLIIVAGSTTNKGLFCAGNGANVNDAAANVPGGAGGAVLLSFDPGLFTNTGQVVAGNGGNSHPDATPPQPGGNGGNITILATAAARLNNSDVKAGSGGTGSPNGGIGEIVIGAPVINRENTRFTNGTLLLFDQNSEAYNFTAIGPKFVTVSPNGLAVFGIRVFNRGARQDTFVASPLATPTGWVTNNLPATMNLRAFRSNLIYVALTIPVDQLASSASEATVNADFSVVVASQHDAGNQIVIPLRIIATETGYQLRMPNVSR